MSHSGTILTFGTLILLLAAIILMFIKYCAVTIRSRRHGRPQRKTSKQELMDLLETHTSSEQKQKIVYAVIPDAEEVVSSLDNEPTLLGKYLGRFVFFVTAGPLIIAAVICVSDLLFLCFHLFIPDLPWPQGFGFVAFIFMFIPFTILAGLAMLPFGYRSQFRFGTCETILTFVTLIAVLLQASNYSLIVDSDEVGVNVALWHYLIASGFSIFGLLYFICSRFGLTTTLPGTQRQRPFTQYGNWPRIEEEPEL